MMNAPLIFNFQKNHSTGENHIGFDACPGARDLKSPICRVDDSVHIRCLFPDDKGNNFWSNGFLPMVYFL